MQVIVRADGDPAAWITAIGKVAVFIFNGIIDILMVIFSQLIYWKNY